MELPAVDTMNILNKLWSEWPNYFFRVFGHHFSGFSPYVDVDYLSNQQENSKNCTKYASYEGLIKASQQDVENLLEKINDQPVIANSIFHRLENILSLNLQQTEVSRLLQVEALKATALQNDFIYRKVVSQQKWKNNVIRLLLEDAEKVGEDKPIMKSSIKKKKKNTLESPQSSTSISPVQQESKPEKPFSETSKVLSIPSMLNELNYVSDSSSIPAQGSPKKMLQQDLLTPLEEQKSILDQRKRSAPINYILNEPPKRIKSADSLPQMLASQKLFDANSTNLTSAYAPIATLASTGIPGTFGISDSTERSENCDNSKTNDYSLIGDARTDKRSINDDTIKEEYREAPFSQHYRYHAHKVQQRQERESRAAEGTQISEAVDAGVQNLDKEKSPSSLLESRGLDNHVNALQGLKHRIWEFKKAVLNLHLQFINNPFGPFENIDIFKEMTFDQIYRLAFSTILPAKTEPSDHSNGSAQIKATKKICKVSNKEAVPKKFEGESDDDEAEADDFDIKGENEKQQDCEVTLSDRSPNYRKRGGKEKLSMSPL